MEDLICRGVKQRVLALEAFLADVYGGQGRVFDDGVVPWRAIFTSETFRREVVGFEPPNGVRCHVSAIDLVRDERGGFRVLDDNVGVFADRQDRQDRQGGQVAEYPSRLLPALRAAAPPGATDPFIVVLTPRARGTTYAEHTTLARLMGVELVAGRDLFCWRNRVYARTPHGRRQVDVICRRVDDEWLDPLQFRPDSPFGCPGLVNAARVGHVTIANGIGNGVADGKLVYPYVPDLVRYYLGQEPILENAEPAPPVLAGGERAPRRVIDLRAIAVNDGRDVWVVLAGQGG